MKSPWICGNLAAEAAADLGGNHAEAILRNAADERHDEPDDVRVLRGVPERELAGRGNVMRQRPARFHRCRDQALLDDPVADDDFRRLECRIDVATGNRPFESNVVRRFHVQLRRPGLTAFSGSIVAGSGS